MRGSRLRRKRTAFELLALLLAFFLLNLSLTGCASSTPERAVREFINYRMEGDESRAAGLTVEGDLEGYLGGEPYLSGSEASFIPELVESRKDRAVVRVRFCWGEQEIEISYVCRRVGSRWKVALRETEELWFPDVEHDGGPPAPG